MAQTRQHQEIEHKCLLMDLIDEFCAAGDDALPVSDPGRNDDTACIERLRSNRSRLELFGFDMTPDDRLSAGAADDCVAAYDHASDRIPALRIDGDGLPDAD